MAKKIKKTVYEGGIEDSLSSAAAIVKIGGFIGLVACIYIAGDITKGRYDGWAENGISYIWVIYGVGILLGNIIMSIILKALSEIIKLLKKQNGMRYSGDITQPNRVIQCECSGCNGVVAGSDISCPSCGTTFK